MYQLGGHALSLSPQEIQMGKRETPSDTGRVLARYIDAIMVRTFDHEELEELAGAADVPVVNGLSDTHHPCQALADLLTVREEFGTLEGVKIAYVGDGNNVAHSLAIACALTGAELAIAHPGGHGPDPKVVETARELGAAPVLTEDPCEAAGGARVVYTDVWASMGQEAEAAERREKFAPFQVNEELMGAQGRGGDGRGHRRTAEPRLRPGREPAARPEGAPVPVVGIIERRSRPPALRAHPVVLLRARQPRFQGRRRGTGCQSGLVS
jgi:ornithine carbamoyltransferase